MTIAIHVKPVNTERVASSKLEPVICSSVLVNEQFLIYNQGWFPVVHARTGESKLLKAKQKSPITFDNGLGEAVYSVIFNFDLLLEREHVILLKFLSTNLEWNK